MIFGGIGLGGNWLFLFEAYRQMGVSLGAIFNYCAPALVILCSPILFREKLTWIKLVSVACALVGSICISGEALSGGLTAWGVICGIFAAVTFCMMIVFNRFVTHVKGLERPYPNLGLGCALRWLFTLYRRIAYSTRYVRYYTAPHIRLY